MSAIITILASVLLLCLMVLLPSSIESKMSSSETSDTKKIKKKRRSLFSLENPIKRNRLCYSQKEDFHDQIAGEWYTGTTRSALYWNLSCPMEVSKQACSHFGRDLDHAEYAAHLHFQPRSCSLLSVTEMLPYFASLNRTLVFIGNSLTREVLLGIACNAHALGLVERFHMEWLDCSMPHRYPCHGASNCITCGPHSGFKDTGAKVYFKGGTVIETIDSYETELPHVFAQRNDSIDFVISQRWHLEDRGLTAFAHHRIASKLPLPSLIWWNGFPAHFPSGGLLYQGQYNETELAKILKTEGVINCEESVGPVGGVFNSNAELNSLWPTTAFFQIEGTHALGKAKVGNVVGKYGDCQHFCSPGPADMMAVPFLQLILAVDHFKSINNHA